MQTFTLPRSAGERVAARPALSPIALQRNRDAAVDIIKGTACLLMVAAHVSFAQAPWLRDATMGAVLFFASTGMNLVGIVERRAGQEKRLAANALFLIFAGFADNYVQGTLWMSDVFQIAGMAILAMLLLRRLCPNYWTWLFPLPFLIHLANQQFQWKTSGAGVGSFFLTPGLFPLLPWLSFYLLGAHLKKFEGQRQGWLASGGALSILVLLALVGPFQFDKWNMSPEYFLVGCAATAGSFAGLRRWLTERGTERLLEIRRWGANSLVFYILHNFVIRALEMLVPHGVGLFLLALVITAMLLRPALQLQAWTAQRHAARVLVAGTIVSLAVLSANSFLWPQMFHLRTMAGFGLTLSFIACYPAWKNISRLAARPTMPVTP